jgi:hypothetical protein
MDLGTKILLVSLGLLALVLLWRLLGGDPDKIRARNGLPPRGGKVRDLTMTRRIRAERLARGKGDNWLTRPLFYFDARGRLPRISFRPPKV